MNWGESMVLVTGGSRGIGKELVKQLLEKGAKVIATGQSEATISKANVEIPGATWLVLDQASEDSRNGFLQQIQGMNINVLINNAGVQQLRDFTSSVEPSLFDTQTETEVNFIGPVELTAKLLPSMRTQSDPRVVFVTSGLALAPKRSSPVYCATKAAIRSFVKSLRGQLSHTGWPVKITEALPPLVDTDMTKGRGRNKITAATAAKQILAGIEADKKEIYVGASALLRVIMRISPALGESIMIKL